MERRAETPQPKEMSAYEAGVNFYTHKLEELAKKIESIEVPDSFEGVNTIEELEEAELKLKQLERRKQLNLLQ
jgi:GTP:adenosylcobinamide-phosphate guanylyltransferase